MAIRHQSPEGGMPDAGFQPLVNGPDQWSEEVALQGLEPRGVEIQGSSAPAVRNDAPLLLTTSLDAPWVDVAAQSTEADAVTNTTGVLPWTFNVKCHHCLTKNTFNCPGLATCPYETRRCLIIASRLNSRELLVYKDCTWNCTFLYAVHQPPPTPKYASKTNSFYFVHCCAGMTCNAGGPVNVERDMLPEPTFEEEPVEGTVCLDTSKFLLSLAFFLFSNTLT